MRNIIKFFIEHPTIVNLCVLLIVGLGAMKLMNTDTSYLPKAKVRFIDVAVVYPGATPEQVEEGILLKLEEELDELREALPEDALARDARPALEGPTRAAVEHELGDVLMAAAFLGGYLSLDPGGLCRSALRRCESRFRHMEAALGGTLAGRSLDEMMAAWRGAKESEAAGGKP